MEATFPQRLRQAIPAFFIPNLRDCSRSGSMPGESFTLRITRFKWMRLAFSVIFLSLARKKLKNLLPLTDKRKWYREEYLRSDHWKQLRAAKLGMNPTCELCPSLAHAEPHHLRYRNIFDVTVSDLQTVCRACHNRIHLAIDAAKKLKQEKQIRSERRTAINATLERQPVRPIMLDKFRIPIVTTKILGSKFADLRQELEFALGVEGEDLLGCAIPEFLIYRLGIRVG